MTDAHGRPTIEERLTPEETRAPNHAERARTLVASQRTGTLSTLNEDGYPHGSYVTFAMYEGDPIFLVSKLATHTKNLLQEAKASLLVNESGASDPLANGRVTLLGTCSKVDGPSAAKGGAIREAFLAANSQASYYVDFSDFAFYRLKVESLRYIGGYGRMSWVEQEAWSGSEADPIAPEAAGILEHMNDDHGNAIVAYAQAFTTAHDTKEATMVGIDRYGFDLSVVTGNGSRPARVAFEQEITNALEARKTLVALVKKAREAIAARA